MQYKCQKNASYIFKLAAVVFKAGQLSSKLLVSDLHNKNKKLGQSELCISTFLGFFRCVDYD